MPDELYEMFSKHTQELEAEVGAPTGSLSAILFTDSDWAMVIKVHSLLESLVSRLLTSALNEASLGPALFRLPMGEDITGKLALAKAIGVLTPGERKFIKRIAEVRNMLAHDPSHLAFTLGNYFKELDKAQKKSFIASILFDSDDEPLLSTVLDTMNRNPRLTFAQQVLGLLSVLKQRHFIVRLCAYLTPNQRRAVFEAIPLKSKRVQFKDGLMQITDLEDEGTPTLSFKPEHQRDCAVHDHSQGG